MTRCLASVSILLLLSSSILVAQEKSNCDLEVRVRTPDERMITTPIEVQVLSPQGVVGKLQVVGGEPAHFSVASGRTYRLVASGSGFETVTTNYFTINALENSHQETIQVKPDANQPGESQAGSPVSVSEMSIPKKAGAEMKKGLDAYSKGEMVKASEQFEKAAAEYPHYARAYEMLGVLAMKQSDRVKARDFFSKSMEADATFVPAYVDAARMDLQEQQYAAAESLLTKAISLNPSSPEAVAMLATTEFANKEYEKALADVERTHALRGHEQFAEVHVMAGKVLRMQNRPEAAIAQFQLFLKEKPASPESEAIRNAIASLQSPHR